MSDDRYSNRMRALAELARSQARALETAFRPVRDLDKSDRTTLEKEILKGVDKTTASLDRLAILCERGVAE